MSGQQVYPPIIISLRKDFIHQETLSSRGTFRDYKKLRDMVRGTYHMTMEIEEKASRNLNLLHFFTKGISPCAQLRASCYLDRRTWCVRIIQYIIDILYHGMEEYDRMAEKS